MMKRLSAPVCAFFFLGLIAVGAFAQEAVPEEESDFGFGTVSSVAKDKITVKEYNYETDTEMDVSYGVTSETELEGYESFGEIAAGDQVEVEYVTRANEKVALYVAKEELEAEEVE